MTFKRRHRVQVSEGWAHALWKPRVTRSTMMIERIAPQQEVAAMTMQYLAGELSVRLAQLQAKGRDPLGAAVMRLRHEAETLPPDELAPVVIRALALVDQMCLDSLSRGDTAAFDRQAVICADLAEFGLCAGFLAGDQLQEEAPQ